MVGDDLTVPILEEGREELNDIGPVFGELIRSAVTAQNYILRHSGSFLTAGAYGYSIVGCATRPSSHAFAALRFFRSSERGRRSVSLPRLIKTSERANRFG